MLTKTKIALSSALIFGFASAAFAQQGPDSRANTRAYTAPSASAEFGGRGAGIVIAPNDDDNWSGNSARERDDFTGYAPRDRSSTYSNTPGNQ